MSKKEFTNVRISQSDLNTLNDLKREKDMNEKERATKNIGTAMRMHRSHQVLIEAYEKWRDGTKEEQGRAGDCFIAANILGAFGIENALKALIRRERKKPKGIHNLRKLYDKLEPKTQQRIREKCAAISIPVKEEIRYIRVEGVMDEHQKSFQDWRYMESGKDLPTLLGVLPITLQVLIQTHDEKYREDLKREEKQETGGVSPVMHERVMSYVENVLMPKSG